MPRIQNTFMKQLWICGANGQLGKSLQKYEADFPGFNFICTDKEIDITQPEVVKDFLEKHAVDVIVNCAAYTAVDKAEDDVETAFLLNAEAPKVLAEQANVQACKLVHISTDYVFDGKAHRPYVETDTCMPQSVYGRSKRAGEEAVMATAKDYIIIRTSWLYSEFGNNFYKTIDRLSSERDNLYVVCDQIGSPTYASDLARAILSLLQSDKITQALYHYSNQGVASWYDFAYAIVQANGNPCKVLACSSADYPQKAQRPFYSVMSKAAITAVGEIQIPHWRDALHACCQASMQYCSNKTRYTK